MKFEEATKAFEKAQGDGTGVNIAACTTSMQISKNAWSACPPSGELAPDDKLNVYMALVNNMQLPEASALLDDIIKDNTYAHKVFSALFDNSGLKGELNFTKSGSLQMYLNEGTTDITVLRHFQKAFFTKLSLANAPITDLESLSYLKIRELNLSGTRVARLNQLKNIDLAILNLAHSRFQNLEDLHGRNFTYLDLSQCPIVDLSPLKYIRADELNLAGVPAKNAQEILPLVANNFKKMTLPKHWKQFISEVDLKSEITWSDLPAPILQ
jgi:uncharacterized protein YjbI with pentapeptide repeats